MSTLAQLRSAGLVALAAVLAGLVGFDRSRNDKPAGVRTHALVGAGGAMVVVVSRTLVGEVGDASRAVHAMVTGIGFLGAGTILRDRSRRSISGLTTAASLLVAAAVGTAIGSGLLVLGVLVTVVVLAVLNVRWLLVRTGIDATALEAPRATGPGGPRDEIEQEPMEQNA